MIKLPDFSNPFENENDFYLTCDLNRINKILVQYELYKKIELIPGSIIECGVFKGNSAIRLMAYRKFLNNLSKKIILFDVFGKFPNGGKEDELQRKKFIDDAGIEGISKKQLEKVLKNKKIKNFELIEGDIIKTVKKYKQNHPKLKISLLHVDVDLYEPTKSILENFYSKVSKGGIIILDDYDVFSGETRAVDEFFRNKKIKIRKIENFKTPSYIIKDE